TNEQNDDGDEIDDDLVDAGEDGFHLVHGGEALENPEQEAGGDGAGQRAHAAHHDHHEAEHQEVHADMIVRRQERRVHDARHAGDDGGKAEHDGEAAIDIDAEQAHRLAIGHAGAHHHAEGCELEEGEDRADDYAGEQEIDQAPDRIGDDIG